MWQALIGPVANLVKTYFQNKAQEKKAKHESTMRHIENDAEWEQIQAQASSKSWKD